MRLALTFGITITVDQPLTRREIHDRQLSWALWRRTYEDSHTRWAARYGRTEAAREQYGQKTVFVLAHRYTEPGLRASLLKGRDRELARLLVDEVHGEAAYLGWLQIREVGQAETDDGRSWDDDTIVLHEPDEDAHDGDPPPESLADDAWRWAMDADDGMIRIEYEPTPELHMKGVARQNG